jgi:hypothetical protein
MTETVHPLITPTQFSELKAMLDADASKKHSASGSVSSSLQRILARHQQMVLEAVAQLALTEASRDLKPSLGRVALRLFAAQLRRETP